MLYPERSDLLHTDVLLVHTSLTMVILCLTKQIIFFSRKLENIQVSTSQVLSGNSGVHLIVIYIKKSNLHTGT